MAQRKRWSDLSPAAKTAILVGAMAEAVTTTMAMRDLIRRPPSDVRGRKPLWALGCVVQPFGPLLYLCVGRRRRIS
jgi:hypothetical protein